MTSPDDVRRANEKVRKSWARQAPRYDKSIGFFERRVFGVEHRAWACSRARGATLEVAVGTGLNLPHYPPKTSLTGIDLTPEMLEIARKRAARLGVTIDLRVADAHALPFEDATFDTVVATYSLCNIPDPRTAVFEMARVLRPDGRLVLVDHIRSSVRPLFWIQRAIEIVTVRVEGEHMTRRSLDHVVAAGLQIDERDRLRAGVVERIAARKVS